MIRLEYRLAIPNSFLIFIHYLSINPVFNHAVNPRANIPQVPSQGSGLNPESVEKSEMNSTMNLTNIPNRSGPIRVPPVEGPKKSTIPAQASGIVNNVTRIGPGRPSIVKRGVIGSNQMLTKRSSRPPEDSDLHINSRKATQKNDQQQAKIFSVSNQQKSSTAEEQQQQQRLQNVFDLVRDSNRDFPKEMDHILCRIVARQSAVESIFLGLDSFDMNQIFENKGAVTRKENEDDLFSLDEKVLSNLQDEVNRLKKILEQRRIRGKEKSLRWKKILDNLAGSQISTEDLRTTEQWAQELDNFGSVSSTDGLSPT